LIRALAAAVLLVACSSAEQKTESPAPPPPPSPSSSPIAATTRQLVTAIVPDWEATTAELRLWTRDDKGAWQPAGPAWQGVIGRTGAAWGVGLHGSGAPDGRTGPRKHEGDGKSPAGVFALASTFGYASTPPPRAGLPYTAVDASWKCVDDPASRHYNQILDERTVTKDWASAEDMRRTDDVYRWVVEVAHNANRTGGDGSCIFLHVWSGPGSATVGCTAMPEDKLASLLSALSPDVAFVLLPRAEYDALAPTWRLP
jgi:L,D-peptidoglycan transpeptidase YkuD (ErfK/YbiS/YcfS/YnhG family)